MVDCMTQIGHKSYQLALDKFATIFEALDNDMQHVDEPLDLDVVMEDEEWLEERKKMQDHLEELKKELDAYCLQLICLGFNSAKYDLNLVKTHIAKHLDMHNGQKCSPLREITNTLV
jgi:phosphate uptake regulator